MEATETDNTQTIPDSGNCSASSCSLADSIDTNSCHQPGFIIAFHRKWVLFPSFLKPTYEVRLLNHKILWDQSIWRIAMYLSIFCLHWHKIPNNLVSSLNGVIFTRTLRKQIYVMFPSLIMLDWSFISTMLKVNTNFLLVLNRKYNPVVISKIIYSRG